MAEVQHLDREDTHDVHCYAEKTKLDEEDQQPY